MTRDRGFIKRFSSTKHLRPRFARQSGEIAIILTPNLNSSPHPPLPPALIEHIKGMDPRAVAELLLK